MHEQRLHLGCGSEVKSGWINVDLSNTRNPKVLVLNCATKWVFPANYFYAVYSCHMLEHLSECLADKLLKNIFLSLRPGGIFRVCVPDLEYNAALYLQAIKRAKSISASKSDHEKYKWAFLNLIDQMIREYPGGQLKKYLQTCSKDALLNAVKTTGGIEALNNRHPENNKPRTIRNFLNYIREKIGWPSEKWKGEMHRFMYDEVNLREKLAQTGFINIKRKYSGKSRIGKFISYQFETLPTGQERKPNSLIIEASKPRK